MGFNFPLVTVLRHREIVEQQEEQALSKIMAELAQVRSRIETLTSEIAHARQALEQRMQQAIPAIDIALIGSHIDADLQLRNDLLESVLELERKREAQSRKYQTAYNRRKILSEMRDRQREEYVQERGRAEQKLLDDIYASRTQRG